jgi:outer membrane protein assembly factor BamB
MRRLRIFVSSPGDVEKERQIARGAIARLAAEFADRVAIDSYFWEYEPMRITAGFQAQIQPPSEFDIVVCILWSRMGTPLRAPDGRRYSSGTEYELTTAMKAHRQQGFPDVLVYRNRTAAQIKRSPKAARERAYQQLDALEAFLEKLAIDPLSGMIKGAIIRYANLAEFEERVELHLRRLVEERLAAGRDAAPVQARKSVWDGNPFRGLELFELKHAAIFFGRTKAIGDVIDILRRQALEFEERTHSGEQKALETANEGSEQGPPSIPATFVLISAMSGVGKSSLVRAGVLPLLTQPGVIDGVGLWRWSIMLPSGSGDLFDGLAQALVEPNALPELTSGGKDAGQIAMLLRRSPAAIDLLISQSLAHAADLLYKDEDRQLERLIEKHRLERDNEEAERCAEVRRDLKPRAARLVLVIDQLEEIFTLAKFRDATRTVADFIAALGSLARSGNVFVIATLRSDFFGHCAELPELMDLKKGEGHYDLAPPTLSEIGQIIRQPAMAAGLNFETIGEAGQEVQLDEVLRDEAIGHVEALPLLEFCLSGLYELRVGNLLTHEAYRRLGGVEGALAKRAEDVFGGLSRHGKDAFDLVMRQLATAIREKDGLAYSRAWADRNDLCALPGGEEFIDAFLHKSARLFIADDRGGKGVVTLTHEALLRAWPRLTRWLEANSDMLQVKAAVAAAGQQWLNAGKDPSYLLPPGLQLEKAKHALRDGYLAGDEATFVRASIRAERKVVLRRRIALGVIFGVVAAGIGGAIQYGWQLYDQGRLSVASNEQTAKVRIDDLELGLPVNNLALRSGRHTLRAFATDFIDRTQTVDIKRGAAGAVQSYLWLEKGLTWTYSSPATQSGLAILPDANGGAPVIAHNEITQIIFLSSVDGSVIKTLPTPTGNWRTFKTIDLGGDVGNVVVSGLDQEQSGPDLTVIHGTAPPQVMWAWRGDATHFGTPQGLAVEPLPRAGRHADLLVAGRDGKLHVLDGKSGQDLQTLTLSDQPLAAPPLLFAWQSSRDLVITALIRPGDPNHYSTIMPNIVALALRLDGSLLWRRDLGEHWNSAFLPSPIDGRPQIILWSDKSWQTVDAGTGASHGPWTLPSPLIGAPSVANIKGQPHLGLVLEFTDAAQPMVAVNPVDGTTIWRGPRGLNARIQPRNGYDILQTSSGNLLVVTEDSLVAVDPRSGQIVWRKSGVPRGVMVGDWDGDGVDEIVLTISGLGLVCLDESGNVRWTLRLDQDVEPWAFIDSKDGGSMRDILIHRHAALIAQVHGPEMLWEQKANAAIQATPLVAHDASGKAIVIAFAPWGNDVAMRAFDGAYGNAVWAEKESFSPNRSGTLADIDGTGETDVVAIDLPSHGSNALTVYRATDGKPLRIKDTGVKSWLSCAPAVADFRSIGRADVAFSTWDERSIVMVDGRSGEILWRFGTAAPGMSGVASGDLDGDGHPDVLVNSPDGYVYALRGEDGQLLWKTPITGGGWSVPSVAALDGNAPLYVLVTSFVGELYVLNGRTGAVVWSGTAGSTSTRENVTMGDLKVAGHAVEVRDAGRTLILAPTGAGGLVAIDWRTRRELWRSPAGFPVINTPVAIELTGHRGLGVVVAAAAGDVWILGLGDGKPLWHRQLSAKTVEADPVVANLHGDGTPDILIAGYDFELHAISGRGTGIQKRY